MNSGMSPAALDRMMGAPEHQIRAILLALCDDRAVRQRALKHYAAVQSLNSEATGLKRKAAGDLCICVQCDSPFYKEDNVRRACRYHPGGFTPHISCRWGWDIDR